MNIKKNTNNLFAEWKEIHKNIRYSTPSPYPDEDYYNSPEPLPYCTNSKCYFMPPYKVNEISFYLREQLAVLKFNNPGVDALFLNSIFQRFLNWKGNKQLKDFLNEYNHIDILNEEIDIVANSDDVSKFIELDYTKHWYGDRIDNLPTDPMNKKWGERRWEKHKLRTSYANQQNRKRIEDVSLRYQYENFGILPTVADIKEITGMSAFLINSCGEGMFITKSENKKQRIIKYLELENALTYKQIAEKYNVTERTVKRYSKFK